MSSKLALIISTFFFALFFVLSIDLICIQYYLSELDSKSTLISYELSRVETIDDELIQGIEDRYRVNVVYISNKNPEFGEVIDYVISINYEPLIVSNEAMQIKVERNTVIGYY